MTVRTGMALAAALALMVGTTACNRGDRSIEVTTTATCCGELSGQ